MCIHSAYYYSVEAALQGHPDKVCDQIADTVLDAFLHADSNAKVAIECLGCGNQLHLAGEVSTSADVDVESIARGVYRDIGYTQAIHVSSHIQSQSAQLRGVVDSGAAGDQGITYGFATDSGFNYLPYGTFAINDIARAIDALRHRTRLFLPDGKVQATIRNGEIETLVISVQHEPAADLDSLRTSILDEAVRKVVALDAMKRVMFNNKSSFLSGGFANDTGLTGRKQAMDTYCGLVPHGGGSFSGKDPSKVDRSAAYMARFMAKSIVANGMADHCIISLAYAFGEADPVMIDVRTDNPDRDGTLLALISERFDLRPPAIIERLGLRHTLFRPTATYGHFTDPAYPWECVTQL